MTFSWRCSMPTSCTAHVCPTPLWLLCPRRTLVNQNPTAAQLSSGHSRSWRGLWSSAKMVWQNLLFFLHCHAFFARTTSNTFLVVMPVNEELFNKTGNLGKQIIPSQRTSSFIWRQCISCDQYLLNLNLSIYCKKNINCWLKWYQVAQKTSERLWKVVS